MGNQYTKKEYSINEIELIISKYQSGISFSKIAGELGRQKNNIKKLLIEHNVWVNGKNNIKKIFSEIEIKEIEKLYTIGLSCETIALKFNVSKTPIRQLLKINGLLRIGNSNGKKIFLTNEQIEKIKNLYLNKYKSLEEISLETGLTSSFINKYLSTTDYRRNKSEATSVGLVKRYRNIPYNEFIDIIKEYYQYELIVKKITNQQPIHLLNNFGKRGKTGIEGAYHLDHKYSIVEGFKNNILPEIIVNINNLEFIPWKENLSKRAKCSITKEELIKI